MYPKAGKGNARMDLSMERSFFIIYWRERKLKTGLRPPAASAPTKSVEVSCVRDCEYTEGVSRSLWKDLFGRVLCYVCPSPSPPLTTAAPRPLSKVSSAASLPLALLLPRTPSHPYSLPSKQVTATRNRKLN